jgi:hypothetical protein
MEVKNEVGLSEKGIAVMVEKEPRAVKFVAWPNFENWIEDDRMTTGNRTVGAHNRRWMHKKLDEFIDSL